MRDACPAAAAAGAAEPAHPWMRVTVADVTGTRFPYSVFLAWAYVSDFKLIGGVPLPLLAEHCFHRAAGSM